MADGEIEGPPEREVKDFHFKEMRKIRVFDSPSELPTGRTSLLATSSKYGVTFVGCPTGIRIIRTADLGIINLRDEGSMQNILTNYTSSYVDIGHQVHHVALSSDELTLSVSFKQGMACALGFFDIRTLVSQKDKSELFFSFNLTGESETTLIDLKWNPGIPSVFAVCLSNGSLALYELSDSGVKQLSALPPAAGIQAMCWSPKGKQIVGGHKNGSLTQYNHAMQVKKEIGCPQCFPPEDPQQVTDILWITATLFAVVYTSLEEGEMPNFVLISTPKTEPTPVVTNFEDIYYGMNEDRQNCFFMSLIRDWDILASVSCNAFEVALLAKQEGDKGVWEKWAFDDTGRASMPLTYDNDETLPMGMAIDFSSTQKIQEADKVFPPAPILLLLSTDGVLCPFYMVNQNPNATHAIVKPPEPVPQGGERKKTSFPQQAVTSSTMASQPAAQPNRVPTAIPSSVGTSTPSRISIANPIPVSQAATAVVTPPISASTGAGSLSGFRLPEAPPPSQPATATAGIPGASAPIGSSFPRFGLQKSAPPSSAASSNVGILGNAPPVSSAGFGFAQPSPLGYPFSFAASTNKAIQPQLSQPKDGKQGTVPVPSNQPPAFPAASQANVLPQPISQQHKPQMTQPSVPRLATEQARTALQQPKMTQPVPSKPLATSAAQPQASQQSRPPPPYSSKTPAQYQERSDSPSEEDVDRSLAKHIFDEISQFEKELTELKESMFEMTGNCKEMVNQNSLQEFRSQTDNIAGFCQELKNTTKEHQKDVNDFKAQLLESFEMIEDAKVRKEKNTDPQYLHLLKCRSLDPASANKMRDIRSVYLHLDKTLREVNLTLDEEWNKENQQKRGLQRPALDTVYRTLRDHHKIVHEQASVLDKISDQMKSRRLLAASWQRPSVNTFSGRDDDLSSLADSLLQQKPESPTRSIQPTAPVSPKKQAQLRNILRKRQTTPVRRSTLAPSPEKSRVSRNTAKSLSNGSVLKGFKTPFVQEVPSPRETQLRKPIFASTPTSKDVPGPSPFQDFALLGSKKEQDQPDVSEEGQDSGATSVDLSPNEPTKLSSTQSESLPTWHHPPEPKPTSGFKLPGQPPSSTETTASVPAVFSKPITPPSTPPTAKPITSDIPPTRAAAIAAMNRAATLQIKPPEKSTLDLGASIEPATMVVHKPTGKSSSDTKLADKGGPSAQIIADLALHAAQNEAHKPVQAWPPRSSTEFTFKGSKDGAGPPVAVFKPAAEAGKSVMAPNVTVKPLATTAAPAVAKPTFSLGAGKGESKPAASSGFQFNFGSPQVGGATGSPFSSFTKPTSIKPPDITSPPVGFQFGPREDTVPTVSQKSTEATAASFADVPASGGKKEPSTKVPGKGLAGLPPFSFISGEGSAVGTVNLSPGGGKTENTVAPSTGVPATKPSISVPGSSGSVNRNLFGAIPGVGIFGAGVVAARAGDEKKDTVSAPVTEVHDKKSSINKEPAGFDSDSTKGSTTVSAPESGQIVMPTAVSEVSTTIPPTTVPQVTPAIAQPNVALSTNKATPFSFGANTSSPFAAEAPKTIFDAKVPSTTTSSATAATESDSGQPTGPGLGLTSIASTSSGLPGTTPPVSTSAGLFGTVPANTTSAASTGLFGSAPATTAPTASTGLFGSAPATTAPTASTGLFRTAPATTAPTANTGLFGTVTATTAPTASAGLFGTVTATTAPTASAGLFVTTPATTAQTASTGLFGSAPATTAPTASTGLFGTAPATTAPTVSTGLFRTAPATTALTASTGLFVTAPATTAPTASTGLFRTAPATTAPTASTGLFGSAPATTALTASTGIFGTAPATATSSPFGAVASGVQTEALFGATPATSTVASFGNPNSAPGPFTGSPIFGSKPATLTSGQGLFGQAASAEPASHATTTPAFGQTAFSRPQEEGMGFGGFGLGGKPQNATKNPFGVSQEGFSSSTTSSGASLFGGKSGSDLFKTDSKPTFGSGSFSSGFGSPSSGFGAGSFTKGGSGVAASGFGVSAASSPAPASTAFGGSPSFGGSPAFGQSPGIGAAPTFGSNPSFGGTPTFGGSPQAGVGSSPGRVFGGGAFGGTSGSPTFGALAAQPDVPSFGSVATQPLQGFGAAPQQQTSPFGGGAVFGSPSSGGSFGSWR